MSHIGVTGEIWFEDSCCAEIIINCLDRASGS
jgi:hypothetical protein